MFFGPFFCKVTSKMRFLRQKHVFSSKIVKNHVLFVKKHVYWASWRSPRPPPDPPKAAPRPPRASSGLGLGQEANWGDSGGTQIHPDLRFPLFFDDLELIPGIPGIPLIRGIPGSCPQTPVRDLPSTRAGGQDDVSSTQTPSNDHL